VSNQGRQRGRCEWKGRGGKKNQGGPRGVTNGIYKAAMFKEARERGEQDDTKEERILLIKYTH